MYLHGYKTQFQLLLHLKYMAANTQTFHIYFHQWSIMMILVIFHHIYRVEFQQELRVLCQVQYLHYDQAWYHQLIQVKLIAKNNQKIHKENHQSSNLMIIPHYNHMHQVGIDPSNVPYSFPSPKPSSVTFYVTSLGPYNNPIPDPTNKPSNLSSVVTITLT